MLKASGVWFGYDAHTPALKGVDLVAAPDQILGILGPNGSGKTTLLRMLAGTRQPQRGSVTLEGTPLVQLSRAVLARRMAVVPQETQLAFDYTVAEVAMMGRYAHLGPFAIEGPADLAIVDEALEATGTRQLKDRLYATLSGGEKQRVVIASALAQISRADAAFRRKADAAGILLLDEPTASLDLKYQLEIASLLRRLHDERQISIVVSTHDLGLAADLCDTLAMIREGSIAAVGPADAVLTPDNVRNVYGVDADVVAHPSGRRLVVPLRRAEPPPPA
jgi:iron complex transport system ATP-binding protein